MKKQDSSQELSTAQRMKESLLTFCRHTTAHGLCTVPYSSNKFSRAIWLTLFFAALAGIAYQTTGIMTAYYSYPVQEVNHMDQGPVPFPDVTVCNIEPIVMSKALELANDPSTATHEYNEKKVPLIRDLLLRNPTSIAGMASRVGTSKGYFENQPQNESRYASHSLKDLIIGCSYIHKNCVGNLEESFTYKADGTYFNCYTFSPANNPNLSDNTVGLGPESGLSLILFMDTDTADQTFPGIIDVQSNVKQSAGARVTVHNRGTLPNPLIEGFDIMPGHSTSVGVTATRIRRLSEPYTNCTDGAWLKLKPHFEYTPTSCLLLSAQEFIFKNCGCLSAELPVPDNLFGEKYCGFYDYDNNTYLEQIECEPKAYVNFYTATDAVKPNTHCRPLCDTFQYDFLLSEAYWPKERYEASFFEEYVASRPDRDSLQAYTSLVNYSTTEDSKIRRNFARVNIYMKSLETLTRSQMPSYQSSNLLSDIGGTLGLWAGISIITVCEIISFAVRLAVTLPRKENI
ncbi:hypothetical protein CAPTEDRAFT_207658 [Capitella teleta]|uniref:Uncharacterized protein n=1 Tax=Capitella teleta TaxID=283909 RepID=R7UUK3_CAPTE|nr:hypothetical protein CAPTEDRAFT_207658 [Capitella teleta]|eukprot:ELU09875.1 hypothetical protein CAPTEDRAFT_207658 [Capitella teleta]